MTGTALVLGASPTGLAVLRALGPRGIDCYVADTDERRIAFRSRYRTGPISVGEAPIDAIESGVDALPVGTTKPIVIPTSDAMVLALSEFMRRRPNVIESYSAIETGLASKIVDKRQFHELCVHAGVETPRAAFPDSAEQLLDVSKGFQFPILIKPRLGHMWRDRLAGKKLLIAQSPAQLEEIAEQFHEECGGLIVQELIPGSESNLYVAAVYRGKGGGRSACFIGEKTRQYPPDFGSASYVTAKFDERVAELSWKFLEAIDYRGVCGTEFKFDHRDNRFKMIEVNPRPTLWFHLAAAAKVNLLHKMYCDLAGEEAEFSDTQTEGTKWCFQEKDLLTWRHHLRQRDVSLVSLLSTLSPLNHGAVLSLRDPMPFLASPLYYLRRIRDRFRRTGK